MNEPLPVEKPTVLYAHREDLEGIFARAKHSVDDQGDYWIEWMQRGESKKCLWIFGIFWATPKQAVLLLD